jgi:hypothetical protein
MYKVVFGFSYFDQNSKKETVENNPKVPGREHFRPIHDSIP